MLATAYNNFKKVVLIEDDADDAELTLYALSKINITNIIHLNDGADALHYLLAANPDDISLILLDIRMPKVDGIQILKALKNDIFRKNIPVLAQVCSRDGKQYVEIQGVKPDGFLMKPLQVNEFLKSLAAIGCHVD